MSADTAGPRLYRCSVCGVYATKSLFAIQRPALICRRCQAANPAGPAVTSPAGPPRKGGS